MIAAYPIKQLNAEVSVSGFWLLFLVLLLGCRRLAPIGLLISRLDGSKEADQLKGQDCLLKIENDSETIIPREKGVLLLASVYTIGSNLRI